MIRPRPCSVIAGTTALVARNVPSTLTVTAPPVGEGQLVPRFGGEQTGVVDQGVDATIGIDGGRAIASVDSCDVTSVLTKMASPSGSARPRALNHR